MPGAVLLKVALKSIASVSWMAPGAMQLARISYIVNDPTTAGNESLVNILSNLHLPCSAFA
jgi:hypothetical protein